MNNPDKIIIHHSLTNDHKVLSSFEAIRNYHINVKGWSDIGYHGVFEYVDNKPTFRQGRKWTQKGAHCIDQNSTSLGWCIVGNFDKDKLPKDMLALVLSKKAEWEYQLEKDLPIYFHRDFSQKTCPGMNVTKDMFSWENVTNISAWALDGYEFVVENGISDGTRPKDPVTREEVWTMLQRYDSIK